jgi:hypothetical protein
MGWQKSLDLGDFCGRQAGEDIAEIFPRVQAAPPATDQDRIDHGAAPSGLGMANEQPSPAAHRRRPNVILHQVVVDLEAPVRQIIPSGHHTR